MTSAIDMARVALQYGKDDQVKQWANDVIREQEDEPQDPQGGPILCREPDDFYY